MASRGEVDRGAHLVLAPALGKFNLDWHEANERACEKFGVLNVDHVGELSVEHPTGFPNYLQGI
jgi:hypothetical protein